MNDRMCSACGSELPPDARFCPECGSPVEQTATKDTVAGKPEATRQSTKIRDIAIVIGVLVVVGVGYFIFRSPAQPPRPQAEGNVSGHPDVEGMDMGGAMQALSDLPTDYESLVNLGNKFMDEMNFPVAAECYKRALAIDGSSTNVRTDYGACLHGMGLPHRALEEFQTVLKQNPEHAIVQFNIGIVFHDLQELDSAKYYWQKYLELDPEGPAAPAARNLLSELDQ
jgi:tetratricopeptide (TPR) repeat protein